MLRPILTKLVLAKTGQTTQTYDLSTTTNRIWALSHVEQEWSNIAPVVVMSDATLAALDLTGYTATISYGYNDVTAGDEFSACAPLEVMAQNSDTVLYKNQPQLLTAFISAGIFDLMVAEKATTRYTQESTDTQTVKTLLTAVAQATLAPFTSCKAHTITFDSEDSLIDTYVPADYFSVGFGESRLSAFKKLIVTTKCKAIIKADGIHVLNSTISGGTYDYQFNDAATEHNFFEKGTRKRLVIPNRIIVSSSPDHTPQYTGNDYDSATYSALGNRYIDAPYYIRATSDAQCAAIATAILQHRQVDAEKGHGLVPMNCGQEVFDYILFTDSVANDTRAGNVGYLKRTYIPGRQFSTELRFGKLAGEFPFLSPAFDAANGGVTWEAFYALQNYIDEKDNLLLKFIMDLDTVAKWRVTQRLNIPVK